MADINDFDNMYTRSLGQYNPHLQKWELAEDSVSLFVD